MTSSVSVMLRRLAWCLLATLPFLGSTPRATSDPALSKTGDQINAFALRLLRVRAAADDAPVNAVFSPQGLYENLAISYVASGGATRRELASATGFPEDNAGLVAGLGPLRQALTRADRHRRVELTSANGLWLDQTYATFRPEYVRSIRDDFAANAASTRFAAAQTVSDEINRWVARRTNDRITGLVGPGDFASRSAPGIVDEPGLVSVNALYYRAEWASRFDPALTRELPFRLGNGTSRPVMMMHQDTLLPYAESGDWQMLVMPAADPTLAMVILLPRTVRPVDDLVRRLSLEEFRALALRARSHTVDVHLPRFAVRDTWDAKNVLGSLGVRAAFDRRRADFDRMIIKKPDAYRIYLSTLRQAAWVGVDEKGAEAAAATAGVHYSLGCSAMPMPEKVTFHADHPFAWFILHQPSRTILFAGWTGNPTVP